MNLQLSSPHSATSIAPEIAQIIEAAASHLQRGESIDIGAMVEAHPQYADQLRDLLPTVKALIGLCEQHTDPVDSLTDRADSRKAMHEELGDFRIIRELGRGGMGTVFEAEQRSMGRRVALKVLPFAALAHEKSLQRFRNEVRAAAALDHPHIVSVYSVGEERGVHFYAMQLIRGQTLADMIEERRKGEGGRGNESGQAAASCNSALDTQPVASLSTIRTTNSRHAAEFYRTAARLGIQAAEALQHAHDMGVLHRDIKPGNLLLDGEGQLFITDFGLARIEADAGLTMTGDIIGTLRYMAPEQALAKRVVIDHRADIYSLGATLYELLTLEPAFGETDRSELLKRIAFDEPLALRKINRRIPAELDTIVLKAMAKVPDDRYQTAQQLADDLRAFLDDKPIEAKPPTLLQRANKIMRRHKSVSILLAVAAILFLIATTAVVADRRRQVRDATQSVETSLQASIAALEADDVQVAAQRLVEAQTRIHAVRLANPSLLRQVAALKSETERYVKFVPLLEDARMSRSFKENDLQTLKALAVYGVMDNPKWLDLLRTAGLPETHIKRVAEGVYELLLLEADRLIRSPDAWPKATRLARLESQSREAVEILDKAAAFHAPSRGYYWLLANCSLHLGNKDKEKRLRITALETPPHDAAELFCINRDHRWGTVSHYRGYPEYTFEQSYKDHREMLRLDPTYYNAMFFMALCFSGDGRYEEALVGWYACVAMKPDDYVAIINRGETHSRLGHFEEAKADYETALAALPDHPVMLAAVAICLATDPVNEMRDGKRAVELARKACKLTDFANPEWVDALAAAHAETGDFESAVKWSEMAVELSDNYLRDRYLEHLESFRNGKPWRNK